MATLRSSLLILLSTTRAGLRARRSGSRLSCVCSSSTTSEQCSRHSLDSTYPGIIWTSHTVTSSKNCILFPSLGYPRLAYMPSDTLERDRRALSIWNPSKEREYCCSESHRRRQGLNRRRDPSTSRSLWRSRRSPSGTSTRLHVG